MGLYELMLVITPDMEKEDHEEVLNGLKETITRYDGTVDKVVDWRKRRLAYEIEKFVEGHYYLVYFSGKGSIIPEIEHFFKVNDAVLRFLIVRIEEEEYDSAVAEKAVETEAPVSASETDQMDQENADPAEPVSSEDPPAEETMSE